MTQPEFIKPADYTPDMGEVAKISVENAKKLKEYFENTHKRNQQLEKWFKEDKLDGVEPILEDEDEYN